MRREAGAPKVGHFPRFNTQANPWLFLASVGLLAFVAALVLLPPCGLTAC